MIDRKKRLAGLLASTGSPLRYSDHQIGLGPAFYKHACAAKVEGIVSKRADAPYVAGNRGLWLKVKCLNREEFVVIGWTDPEGRRPYLGALLLGYHDSGGRLVYAAGSAPANEAELERLWRKLQPLAVHKMPLNIPPPRSTRFGSPLVISRVHWVRPDLVAEVKYLTWTEDDLLRQVVYEECARTSRRQTCAAPCRIRETPLGKNNGLRASTIRDQQRRQKKAPCNSRFVLNGSTRRFTFVQGRSVPSERYRDNVTPSRGDRPPRQSLSWSFGICVKRRPES